MSTAASWRIVAGASVLGGLVWIPIRLAIGGTWGTTPGGLSYEDWNRLMVLPLALLVGGIAVLLGRPTSRVARTGAWLAGAGLVGMLAGVIIEFWVFGGLAGDRDGAIAGWMVYLLPGVLLHAAGLVVHAVGKRDVVGWLAGAIAVLHLLWIPATMVADALMALDQALIGLLWAGIGVAGWFRGGGAGAV